jgi:hypothetical protein
MGSFATVGVTSNAFGSEGVCCSVGADCTALDDGSREKGDSNDGVIITNSPLLQERGWFHPPKSYEGGG